MTTADRVHVAAAPSPLGTSPLPPSPARLRFVGDRGDYWRLMIRGAALQAITLGIYQFWLFTDMRRFLWSSTEVEGETLEYTGTAVELLIGFLMAIGILIPIYALLFLASLQFGLISELSGVLAFVVLAGFGQYAVYRARRYRLTRTVFRGLRFHQTGSAVQYAIRSLLWAIPILLTLGLLSPWATANLERYKMRNTFYGNLRGSFAGSGWQLFWRGSWIWLLVVGVFVAGVILAVVAVDWAEVGQALGGTGLDFDDLKDEDLKDVLVTLAGNKQLMAGVGVLAAGIGWAMTIGIVLLPAYQAIAMRWWLGGLRLGTAAGASDLRIRRYYFAYLRYVLYVLLFTIAFLLLAGIVGGIGYAALGGTLDFNPKSLQRDGLAVVPILAIVAYVIYVLGCSAIYQVVVRMRLWQVAVESMLISNLAALANVQAGEAASSAVGEGLADALGSGGI